MSVDTLPLAVAHDAKWAPAEDLAHPLPHPVRVARAVEHALRHAGYEVLPLRNAEQANVDNCFAILTPQRAQALPQLQESIGRLHFAGDHTSATAGTHGVYNEARRVANLIRNANPIGR